MLHISELNVGHPSRILVFSSKTCCTSLAAVLRSAEASAAGAVRREDLNIAHRAVNLVGGIIE